MIAPQAAVAVTLKADTCFSGTYAVQVNYASTVLWATLDSNAPPAWNTYAAATIELISGQFTALLLVGVSLLQPAVSLIQVLVHCLFVVGPLAPDCKRCVSNIVWAAHAHTQRVEAHPHPG